ncbi:MAG: FMN-binding glutamate synthase family protein, partial [Deltaproteobacteria bacterium CG_4_10_14_0_2_um_filter_43_8]
YIAVDGGEGGTGAAPLEFSNHVGTPTTESLIFIHNALVGFGLRGMIKIIAAGKMTSAFGMIKRLALGADAIYAARAFMLSLGCIQALRCNTNNCPTGVTTQDPQLVAGLVVSDKRTRVMMYHKETMKGMAELIGAMGLKSHEGLSPHHVIRRVSNNEVKHYGQLYEYLKPHQLLTGNIPQSFSLAMKCSHPDSFANGDEMN